MNLLHERIFSLAGINSKDRLALRTCFAGTKGMKAL
jgi:hypothetical protein